MAFARLVASSWEELAGDFTVGEDDDAVSYPTGWLDGADEDTLISLGVARIVEDPDVAPCLQLLGKVVVDVDGVPHRRWAMPPANDVRTERRDELSALRWQKQQTVKWGGRIADASDTTLGRLMAAVMRAQLSNDPAFSIRWKFGDGDFATLKLADVTSYGMAIGAHMQGCYDREAELVAAIAAAPDAAAICAIDITGGWPA